MTGTTHTFTGLNLVTLPDRLNLIYIVCNKVHKNTKLYMYTNTCTYCGQEKLYVHVYTYTCVSHLAKVEVGVDTLRLVA